MRWFVSICGLVVILSSAVFAQVNIGFGGVSYDASEPIEVTADNLTVDQGTGEAMFAGNVIVVQGNLRIAAETVRVIYTSDDSRRDVQEVIAAMTTSP